LLLNPLRAESNHLVTVQSFEVNEVRAALSGGDIANELG
jgi:hypothetical protein